MSSGFNNAREPCIYRLKKSSEELRYSLPWLACTKRRFFLPFTIHYHAQKEYSFFFLLFIIMCQKEILSSFYYSLSCVERRFFFLLLFIIMHRKEILSSFYYWGNNSLSENIVHAIYIYIYIYIIPHKYISFH